MTPGGDSLKTAALSPGSRYVHRYRWTLPAWQYPPAHLKRNLGVEVECDASLSPHRLVRVVFGGTVPPTPFSSPIPDNLLLHETW